MASFLFSALLTAAWTSTAHAQAPAKGSPIARAPSEPASPRIAELARTREWRALLHQARHRLGRGAKRSLGEAHFFLAETGDEEPELELRATIAAMRGDSAHAQALRCRFPARHLLLAEHGLASPERGPCPEFEDWRAQIGDVRLTLVFPEAFLGNPSSMFGHTLLRFDPVPPPGSARSEALLGWTLDYTADPGTDPAPVYLVRGLTGGYDGHFGIAPYYQKTKLYSDWQDRDIWEYPLDMSPDAIERVLLHVWEMRDAGLPYLFFTKNCSEYLLDILEVGWPGIGRGGGFPPAVTPVDTLRAMMQVSPGAVGEPRLRASPATRLQDALGGLDQEGAVLVEGLANGSLEPGDARVEERALEERARLLTLAYDLTRHTVNAGRMNAEQARERSRELLRARAALRVPREPLTPLEHIERVPPHEGHKTARVAVAGGIQDREGFIELRGMPAFHTQLDAPGGFAEGGEIKFLDTALRYYPDLHRVRFHEFVALDVTTASPWRRPFRPLAWHTEIGLRTRMVSRERGEGLKPRSFFRFQGGLGAALAPAPRLHLYAFGELALEASNSIEGNASLAPLLRAGASWSSKDGRYTIHGEALAGVFLGRDPSEWLRLELDQRFTITRDWSLTLGAHLERAYHVTHPEARLGFTRYF